MSNKKPKQLEYTECTEDELDIDDYAYLESIFYWIQLIQKRSNVSILEAIAILKELDYCLDRQERNKNVR